MQGNAALNSLHKFKSHFTECHRIKIKLGKIIFHMIVPLLLVPKY